jgi:hypothetical protein
MIMGITLEQGDFGTYLIVADDGRDRLIQTDWDYPRVASTFGFSLSTVQRCRECGQIHNVELGCKRFACHDCDDLVGEVCDHSGTDGTVDCKECGLKAGAFINSARDFMDDHIGDSADDPGYFDAE